MVDGYDIELLVCGVLVTVSKFFKFRLLLTGCSEISNLYIQIIYWGGKRSLRTAEHYAINNTISHLLHPSSNKEKLSVVVERAASSGKLFGILYIALLYVTLRKRI
jgi:hypothetical protein